MLYKFIDFPNFEETRQEVIKYLPKRYWNHGFKLAEFSKIERCRLLKKGIEYFTPWSNILQIACIPVGPGEKSGIHIDYNLKDYFPYALNLPILNCDNLNCSTVIYKSILDVEHSIIDDNDPRVEILDTIRLTKPAFFHTLLPHQVINNSDSLRFVLSIRFKDTVEF